MSALFTDGSKLCGLLEESKGKAGLHADGTVVACDTVSSSCFIISNVEGPQSGTRKTMGRGDPKMLLCSNCALSPNPSFSEHYVVL